MKRVIFLLFLFLLGTIALSGEVVTFDPENYQSKIILAAFEKEFVGNDNGILEFEIVNGSVFMCFVC